MAFEHISVLAQPASTGGYGPDPNLVNPSVPWPRTLSEDQRRLVAALSDLMLPPQDEFPAPSEMGIVDFLDDWVSAPYPQQKNDNELVLSGFALIDSLSQERFGLRFVDLSEDQKHMIVSGISSGAETPGRLFFSRFRYLVVGGYFTSDIGLKAIGYVGNVPMASCPAVSSEVRQIIDGELARLGLPPVAANEEEHI